MSALVLRTPGSEVWSGRDGPGRDPAWTSQPSPTHQNSHLSCGRPCSCGFGLSRDQCVGATGAAAFGEATVASESEAQGWGQRQAGPAHLHSCSPVPASAEHEARPPPPITGEGTEPGRGSPTAKRPGMVEPEPSPGLSDSQAHERAPPSPPVQRPCQRGARLSLGMPALPTSSAGCSFLPRCQGEAQGSRAGSPRGKVAAQICQACPTCRLSP